MNQLKSGAEQDLALLAEGEPIAERQDRAEARRGPVVALLEHTYLRLRDARARRRDWGRRMVWMAAAAVPLALAGVGLVHRTQQGGVASSEVAFPMLDVRSGVVHLAKSGRARTDVVGHGRTALDLGGEIWVDPSPAADLLLPGGTRVELGAATGLRVAPGDEQAAGMARLRDRFEIIEGEVDVDASQLRSGGSVAVQTPNSTLETERARFSVWAIRGASGASPVTRVAIRDGRVLVHFGIREIVLAAGESWSSETAEATIDLPVEPAPAAPQAVGGTPRVAARAPGASPRGTASAGNADSRASSPASSLADENEIFAQGMAARKAGEFRRAVSLFDRLLAEHRGSPLTQEALVERMRALRVLGASTEASRAARRYLEAYPAGFAADEARKLLVAPTPIP